ncbi:11388_t:CDS:2, partial [Scutellospora calospora]
FFGTVSGFLKNTEIEKVEFEYDIQYKEIATEQHVRTEVADDSLENRETIYENNNGDQIHEIIELLSDEDRTPEIIELSKNQRTISRDQTPETAEEIIEIT